MMQRNEGVLAVQDPGLEIRGGAFGPQFVLKIRGERGPPGPSPRSATVWYMPQPISGIDALMLLYLSISSVLSMIYNPTYLRMRQSFPGV